MRASGSDRTIACPASVSLPRAPRPISESRDKAVEWGNLVHHWKETGEWDPPFASPSDIKTLVKKLKVSGVKSEDWWPDPGTHELTFALELDGLKALEWDPSCGVNRDDWKAAFPADEWLTGTIDYLVIGEGRPWLDDLKTGRWRVDPVTSKQLRSYALYPWVLAGCAPDFEIEVSITQWTKYPLSGSPERSWHQLTHRLSFAC